MTTWLCMLALLQGPAGDAPVRLDLPESVELKVLVDYVASTLELNIIYDEELLRRKVSLRVAHELPRSALLELLRSALRSRGLVLVSDPQPSWFRVVAVEALGSSAGPILRAVPRSASPNEPVTLGLPVRYADVDRLQSILSPFLSKPGGALLVVRESRTLVITDFVDVVRRIAELAALLDVEAATLVMDTIPVLHQESSAIAAAVTRVLAERARLGAPGGAPPDVSLTPDAAGGGLIAIGPAESVAEARRLVERFDVPVERKLVVYRPRFVTAARLRGLLAQLVSLPAAQLVADETGNALLVTAPEAVHARVRALLNELDAVEADAPTPLRFYKLMNRRAADVYVTLAGLLSTSISGRADNGPPAPPAPSVAPDGSLRAAPSGVVTPARPDAEISRDSAARTERYAQPVAVHGEDFSIGLDEGTNSILVIGPPELHQRIERMLADLDKRRPQVLVEVTLVSVAVDDSLNLGVELQALDLGDPWDYLLFTSFGLSSIDPATGQRRLAVAPGGTGVLLAPDEVPIILQALQTNGRTRVYSAPRILVDDNAAGRIESVSEAPYTSVNASDTVATTSFAGFAKAGTQLTIEPHIAEGDHLELQYAITVSSFTGAGGGTTPPPRSADTISSSIRVPDGHTVVVGGLLTDTLGEAVSQVPLLGDIPGLGFLFGLRSSSRSKVRLYAFIRPSVLRDEAFEDLKYLTRDDLDAAGVADDYPPLRYQFMHAPER